MCGIAGEFRFSSTPTQADWQCISELMYRRGPDDMGTWEDAEHCTLVFRRLAILDLTPSGHQPMVSHDGRFAIVFNGELYNFQDLRKELSLHGYRFRSSGDTEVVLNALIHWGKAALAQFNGMFAIGFYDKREKRLLLARDHVGIKPLYFMHTYEGVVFGSQFNQILAHPWSRNASLSPHAASLYLRLGHIPAPYAALTGSNMLAAGTCIEFRADGSKQEERYYTFPRFVTSTLIGNEAIEAVDAAITAAVRRQLISDVSLGAFLSGGIDSPLVVAKIKAAGRNDLHTFTIGTRGDRTDETADAAEYARALGVENTTEHVSPEDALELLDDVVTAMSEPFGDYSIFPTMLVSRLARRRHTVMLSGDGGDEMFWGYAPRAAPMLEAAHIFQFPPWVRRLVWYVSRIGGPSAFARQIVRYPTLGDWQLSAHRRLPSAVLQEIFPALPPLPQGYDEFKFDSHNQTETAQWLRWNETISHLPMVLLKVDRASMHESLEVRVPLLDREVIDTALQVDWRACLDLANKIGKLPLRAALRQHTAYQSKIKRGFDIPMDHWLRTSLKPIFEEHVLSRSELLGAEVDRQALARVYADHCAEKADYGRGLWPLLSAALWEKHHFSPFRGRAGLAG